MRERTLEQSQVRERRKRASTDEPAGGPHIHTPGYGTGTRQLTSTHRSPGAAFALRGPYKRRSHHAGGSVHTGNHSRIHVCFREQCTRQDREPDITVGQEGRWAGEGAPMSGVREHDRPTGQPPGRPERPCESAPPVTLDTSGTRARKWGPEYEQGVGEFAHSLFVYRSLALYAGACLCAEAVHMICRRDSGHR